MAAIVVVIEPEALEAEAGIFEEASKLFEWIEVIEAEVTEPTEASEVGTPSHLRLIETVFVVLLPFTLVRQDSVRLPDFLELFLRELLVVGVFVLAMPNNRITGCHLRASFL